MAPECSHVAGYLAKEDVIWAQVEPYFKEDHFIPGMALDTKKVNMGRRTDIIPMGVGDGPAFQEITSPQLSKVHQSQAVDPKLMGQERGPFGEQANNPPLGGQHVGLGPIVRPRQPPELWIQGQMLRAHSWAPQSPLRMGAATPRFRTPTTFASLCPGGWWSLGGLVEGGSNWGNLRGTRSLKFRSWLLMPRHCSPFRTPTISLTLA